jgi:hypothetical protein
VKASIRFTPEEIKRMILAEARESVTLGEEPRLAEFTFIVGLPDGDLVGAEVVFETKPK